MRQPWRSEVLDQTLTIEEPSPRIGSGDDRMVTAGRITRTLSTATVGSRCIPIKEEQVDAQFDPKHTSSSTQWSLADCYALDNAFSEADFQKCEDLNQKLLKALGRFPHIVAKEYGIEGDQGQTIAIVIRQLCQREPLTKLLLRDPDVKKFLSEEAAKRSAAPPANQSTRNPKIKQ